MYHLAWSVVMTVYSTTLTGVMFRYVFPVESINLTESQDLLPALAYMSHHNKEMLQEEQKEQDIGTCEQWLNVKNDRDYLHPVEKKPGLFVRQTGCFIFKYLCVAIKVPLAEISFSSMSHQL